VNRILSWLLNCLYIVAIVLCAPLIAWQAFRAGKYRNGYREKLFGLVPRREGDEPCIWIHAVSVGEVNLIATLLRELRAAHPDWAAVVSTTSRTGYELARKKYADLTVFYCPLDFSWAVRNALRRIRPSLLVLAELELWPNLIGAATEHGARVAIVNGRLSDRSFPRYRRVRPLVSRMLRQVDLIAAQSEESAARFRAIGVPADRMRVTGSLKYDGAETNRQNQRTAAFRELAGFADDDIVFVAGSTQEPEERIAVDIFRKLSVEHPRLRLVLVPRHPERFDDVGNVLESSNLPWLRRSELDLQSSLLTSRSSLLAPILLVDTVGELGAWWGTATIAFVGGSFGSRGGQNMIEPAAYGAAVCFGPNTWNFRDIVATLLANDAAVVVRDAQELDAFVRRCVDDPSYAAALGARAQQLVQSQLGATRHTLQLIQSLCNCSESSHIAARDAA
jgi:3-deoxy-D-manno-octulosonic-acid transferase